MHNLIKYHNLSEATRAWEQAAYIKPTVMVSNTWGSRVTTKVAASLNVTKSNLLQEQNGPTSSILLWSVLVNHSKPTFSQFMAMLLTPVLSIRRPHSKNVHFSQNHMHQKTDSCTDIRVTRAIELWTLTQLAPGNLTQHDSIMPRAPSLCGL